MAYDIGPNTWAKVKAFFDLISAIAAGKVTLGGALDLTTDPTGGDGVGNRDYNDARYATAAQGGLADTALQPADVGTAAAQDVGYFATAAQGGLADTALQPADVGTAAAQDVGAFVPTDGSVSSITFSNGAKLEISGSTLVITAAP